jgi:hypothetical protein
MLPFPLVVSPLHGHFQGTIRIIEFERDLRVSNTITAPKCRPQGHADVLAIRDQAKKSLEFLGHDVSEYIISLEKGIPGDSIRQSSAAEVTSLGETFQFS